MKYSRRASDNTGYCTNCKNTGLALVEVLVALAIVGIALPALLISVDSVTEGTSHIRDKAIAQWIASDKLTEARIDRLVGKSQPETSNGEVEMAEQRWRWTITAKTTAEVAAFKRLEVSVSKETGNPLVTLVGILQQ